MALVRDQQVEGRRDRADLPLIEQKVEGRLGRRVLFTGGRHGGQSSGGSTWIAGAEFGLAALGAGVLLASTSGVTTNDSKETGNMTSDSPSQLIDGRIVELGDWRGETLARIRDLIKEADPEVVEEWKWRGVPVWEHAGIICTGETYKNYVKTTFAKGASLEDPAGLFNSSLEGNTRRAIDFHEGEEIDEEAFKALIRAAVALNES